MSRQDYFLQAKKKIDEEAKEKEERKNFTPYQYDDIEYAPLESSKIKVFRFYGLPFQARESCDDPKLVYRSKIKDDKEKTFNCTWSPDPDWILRKIYKDVTAYSWDAEAINDKGKPGKRVYNYAKDYPKMLDRVLHNNNEDHPYQGKMISDPGWYPKAGVWMNVISRDDYDWHVKNKHWKMLARKVNIAKSEDGKERIFAETGIAQGTYNMLVTSVVQEHGDWQDFDIAIEKLDSLPFYALYTFQDERKISDKPHAKMSGEPLTKEELSWERYDIDKYTHVTSYKTIQNRLAKFIKEVDGNLGTHYTEELEALVEKEKAEKESAEDSSSEDEGQTEEEYSEDQNDEYQEAMASIKEESRVAEPTPARTRRTGTINSADFWTKAKSYTWTEIKDNKTITHNWSEKGLDLMKKDYERFVSDIPDGETVVFKDEDGNIVDKGSSRLIPCPTCGLLTFDNALVCPRCGTVFDD